MAPTMGSFRPRRTRKPGMRGCPCAASCSAPWRCSGSPCSSWSSCSSRSAPAASRPEALASLVCQDASHLGLTLNGWSLTEGGPRRTLAYDLGGGGHAWWIERTRQYAGARFLLHMDDIETNLNVQSFVVGAPAYYAALLYRCASWPMWGR